MNRTTRKFLPYISSLILIACVALAIIFVPFEAESDSEADSGAEAQLTNIQETSSVNHPAE